MKAKHLIATTLLLAATTNCSSGRKATSEAPSATAEHGSKFESIDLGCQFEDITAQPREDSSLAMTSGSCDNANQYYPMLLTQFDTNGDGQLNGEELTRSQSEYTKAQLVAIDMDDDGLCSLTEISMWRAKNLKARLAKLPTKFKAACSSLQQDDDSCKSLYTKTLDDRRKKLEVEKQRKLASDSAAKPTGLDDYSQPDHGTDDNCVECQPVVKVPVKVKVDVSVDVTKNVTYTNFDDECVLVEPNSSNFGYHY